MKFIKLIYCSCIKAHLHWRIKLNTTNKMCSSLNTVELFSQSSRDIMIMNNMFNISSLIAAIFNFT